MPTVYEVCSAQATAEAEVWHNCADLAITNVVRHRKGDGLDTLTFAIESGTALTDDLTFAYKSYVRFRRTVDGGQPEQLFFGRVTTVPRDGTGTDLEAQSYTVSGPGEQLAATTYRQDWVESTGVITKPRVILFQDSAGARCTTGAQIYDALSWAVTCNVKIAAPDAGNIIAGVALPFDERVNIKCWDAIVECLRWHPHAVIWWDYTLRAPAFHCELRADLASVSRPIPIGGISITERRDLQIPAICICYEKSIQVDDKSWKQTIFDVAPVIAGETAEDKAARLNQIDVVWATFDLEGATQTNASQKMVTEPFPEDYLSLAWWKARETWLNDYGDANIELSNGHRAGESDLPRILIEGTPQPWMNKEVAVEHILVDATITKYDNDQVVLVEKRPISREVKSTDAMTKTYRSVQAYDSGESVPEGVALSFYAEWSGLHCEGSISIEADECSGIYCPGKALDLTGGRAEWATMHAMICESVEHFDSGTTSVKFGPLKTVDVDSLVSLFRATRNRRFAYSRTFRNGAEEGEDPGTGSADPAVNNTYSGLPSTKRLCVMANVSGSNTLFHKVDINPAALSSTPSETTPESDPQTIRMRSIELINNDGPDANGNARVAVSKAYVLCSEPVFDRHDTMTDIPDPSGGGTEFQLFANNGLVLDATTSPPTLKLVGTNGTAPTRAGTLWGYKDVANGYGWLKSVYIVI